MIRFIINKETKLEEIIIFVYRLMLGDATDVSQYFAPEIPWKTLNEWYENMKWPIACLEIMEIARAFD